MNKEIIDKTIAALRHNHFEAFFAHNTAEASAIFFRDIFPGLQVETVSWGDSETMKATGVLNELQKNPELSVIDSFAPGMSRKQKIYWRRQALLTDLFLTGSNALTQKGQLVNLDMIGNRVGGITISIPFQISVPPGRSSQNIRDFFGNTWFLCNTHFHNSARLDSATKIM